MAAALAVTGPEPKAPATCLLTGETAAGMSPLVINHAAGHDTHTHTVMLQPDADESMLKSVTTSPETLAHQYGCAPGALDLCGFTGIKIHGATTTHMGPVGITFSSTHPETGEFVPIQTLTRSCFQHQVHTEDLKAQDPGQMCHYIANPAHVGYVHPPVEMKLHESQTADNMATNLALRQTRWPAKMPMTPPEDYTKIHSEKHGEMAAIPLQTPAQCNVSYLLSTNEADINKIAGASAKVVESTAGKFAMVQTSALNSIKDKLSDSLKTASVFNGGLTCTMFPLTGEPMKKDCVTTVTYSLMKNPTPIFERVANAMAPTETSHIESIRHDTIPYLLGEVNAPADGATAAAMAPPTPVELSSQLQALVDGKK